ncbi:MAG: hypothetical protein LBP95_07460 [Deltaproteobacteria bacterium]|jgi:hypothetical protein|nr:hypothetical protein [Deltaproteobacteria bacterium]
MSQQHAAAEPPGRPAENPRFAGLLARSLLSGKLAGTRPTPAELSAEARDSEFFHPAMVMPSQGPAGELGRGGPAYPPSCPGESGRTGLLATPAAGKAGEAGLPTVAAVRALLGRPEIFRGRTVTKKMVLKYFSLGRRLSAPFARLKPTRRWRARIGGLAAGVESSHGRRFSRPGLYKMVRLADRVGDKGALENWLDCLSWSHVGQLLRLDDPGQAEAWAVIAHDENMSARDLGKLITFDLGLARGESSEAGENTDEPGFLLASLVEAAEYLTVSDNLFVDTSPDDFFPDDASHDD